MDVTLQRHCARYIYVIPDDLRELISDISREVLRSQPDDIYTFIADYLDALLITRENARISAKFVQYLSEASETIVELLNKTGMSREEANRSATVIQEAFKTYSDRKGILKEDEDVVVAKIIEEVGISEGEIQEAALVIQNAFRTFRMRQQKEAQLLTGVVDWRVAARSAIKLYRKVGVSPEEAKRAANLIKAAYKGYYSRRALQVLNEQVDEIENESYEDVFSEISDMGERKSKGVRIDYTSVVPHVDFGDEELFSRDLTSIAEEAEPPEHKDVMTRIFVLETSDQFMRELLDDLITSVVSVDEKVEVVPMDDKESEHDSFMPVVADESEEPEYQRSTILPVVSQEEIESELMEARMEMMQLQQATAEADDG